MLIRTSAKFRQQFPCELEYGIPASKPFPQTWNVDILYIGRHNVLVLASEENTLFSVLVATRRAHRLDLFLDAFRIRLLQLSEKMQIPLIDLQDQDQFTFAQRTNRRIIGSQNDFFFAIKFILADCGNPSPPTDLLAIEDEVNIMPMSYLDMDSPSQAFQRKIK